MHNRVLTLFANEWSKAVRRKLPFFGLFAIGLLCVIIHFFAGQVSSAAVSGAWGYAAFSMQLVFTDLGPVFVLVFAALLMAEETSAGTIRAALAAPVQRWELYLAKAAAGLLYMMILSAFAMMMSAAVGSLHGRFGDVSDAYGVVYSGRQVLREYLTGWVLSWAPLSGLVMYALLVSTLVRTPGAAVAVTIGVLTIVDFTKHLVGIDAFVFTRDVTYPWVVLQQTAQGMDYHWMPEVWRMLMLSGVTSCVLFFTGLIVFVRQDLNH